MLASGGGAVAAPSPGAPAGSVAFGLDAPQLDEISGIAAGIVSPGVIYAENDSGDSARFFALDRRDGRLLAVYEVPGARNVDWEDIAVAPDARGVPSVWLADIGDNSADRDHVTIYRVDEPHVDLSRAGVTERSAAAQAWQLRYPGSASDAESLAVSPAGVPYLVTKSLVGASTVYAAPAEPPAGVGILTELGTIRFARTGTPGPFGPVGPLTATGADLSRDGRTFVVRTYTDAYLWHLGGSGLTAALRAGPERVPLPRQPQGEAICFDGDRLLIASEGVGTAVYALALPAPRPAAPATTRAERASPAPASTSVRAEADGDLRWIPTAAAAAAFVVVALALTRLRRRRP